MADRQIYSTAIQVEKYVANNKEDLFNSSRIYKSCRDRGRQYTGTVPETRRDYYLKWKRLGSVVISSSFSPSPSWHQTPSKKSRKSSFEVGM